MTDTTQPPAETLARPGKIDPCEYCFGVTRHDANCRALTRRAGGDAIPAGEVEAFRRGAEAMQRVLADALRDHLNPRAAAIANGVAIPEYQA